MGLNESDPYGLNRFIDAQKTNYSQALSELRSGSKQSHWMWYVFPQIAGLGNSSMSVRYAIKTEGEARAYLDHRILGPRLIECGEAVLAIQNRSAHDILGSPDDMKLQSCATLFERVSSNSVFDRLLAKYYGGKRDRKTLDLLGVT